jgi:16S rRNA (uracil1498-N3)-methyltransferase
MAIPRIYLPVTLEEGTVLTLDDTQYHHLATVLRIKNGENIIIFNGLGGEYAGEFYATKKNAQVKIATFNAINRESLLDLHLGQGLVRGDRMDFVIQKATELGVAQITPLWTALCSVKLDEARSLKRLQHWQKIAISACEQSGRTIIPIIHPPIALAEWAKQDFTGISLLFDPSGNHSLKATIQNSSTPGAVRLAIGPESGWEEKEIAHMKTLSFIPCQVGPRILRTETAGMVGLSILQNSWGDLA